MKMYKKSLVLLLVSSTFLCQNKQIDQSIERPVLNAVDTTGNENPVTYIDTIVDTVVLKKIESKKKDRKVITKKKETKINDTVKVIDTIKMVKKDECSIEQPESMGLRERPNTIKEAQEWAEWMYKKAKCYKSRHLDSCYYYTQRGIKTFENGSLFYLKAYCLLRSGQYSSSKTAAEISLSRMDHWGKQDKADVLLVKIEALQGLQKSFPSSVIEKEIDDAKKFYSIIVNN